MNSDKPSNEYAILQLRESNDTSRELFSSIRELERMGLCPNIDHYKAVYKAPLPSYSKISSLLEDLYLVFNIGAPKDFKGRSLSVSDVVAIKEDGKISCYYVDSIGFKELPGFMGQEDYQRITENAL